MADTKLGVTLTGDNSQLQQALDKSTEGIHQFGSEILKMAVGFGTVAGAASMLAEKVIEIGKAIIDFIPDSINSTNELAENFKNLHITAGVNLHDFNAFGASIELSGGKAEDLSEIVAGMEKGIKRNADVLIANGIAADQAALSHMNLGEYIKAVVEKMEKLSSATDKDQLLMAAFGRGGMKFAAVLEEINKHMREGLEIAERGGTLDQAAIRNKELITEAQGRLSLAQERGKAVVAGLAAGTDAALLNMKAAALNFATDTALALDAARHHLIQWENAAVAGEAPILKTTQELVAEFRELNHQMDLGAKAGLLDLGREAMHAGISHGDTEFINKQQLDKEAADKKEAARLAQSAARKAEAEAMKDARRLETIAIEHHNKMSEVSNAEVGRLLHQNEEADKKLEEEALKDARAKEKIAIEHRNKMSEVSNEEVGRLLLKNQEAARRADQGWVEELRHMQEQVVGETSHGLTQIITGHEKAGKALKEMWSSVSESVINDVIKMELQQLISDKVVAASSETTMAAKLYAWYASLGPWGIPAAAATIAGVIAAITEIGKISGRELGGPVEAGTPYIVGEAGHELFVPSQSGTIIPHDLTRSMQSIYGAIGASQARTDSYHAASYLPSPSQRASGPAGGGMQLIVQGHVIGEGVQSATVMGRLTKQLMDQYNRRNG